MAGGFQEEKLPNKLNFGVWLRIGKYAFRRPWILILILFLTLFHLLRLKLRPNHDRRGGSGGHGQSGDDS